MQIKNKAELELLQTKVYQANLRILQEKLAILTWGNASMINKERTYFVIKPSGVPYHLLKPSDMVIVDAKNGQVLENQLNASSDTPTHFWLYKSFPKVQSIMHAHAPYSVAFAQAGKDIEIYGTTHADNFVDKIPCTRALKTDEMQENYELNTGKVISEHFQKENLDPLKISATLVRYHGSFVWSDDEVDKVIDLGLTVEMIAKMAYLSEQLNPQIERLPQNILDVHHDRKHGKNAYYGQKKVSRNGKVSHK